MRHIISVLLENEAGALSRVSGLFSARGFNIESLVVSQTNDSSLSRLTLVTIGSDRIIDQIVKQLDKLIDTVSVEDLTKQEHIERELLLLKIYTQEPLEKIEESIALFDAKVINHKEETMMIELSGKSSKLDAFLETINKQDILEVSRTGAMGLYCGKLVL